MKRQTMAVVVMAMALAGGAHAQTLEKSFADQCSTAAAKKSEVCQVMAKALMSKLQAESGAGNAPAPSASASKPAVAPTAVELRARWGFLLDFIGKPTFAIDAETGTADTTSRWVLEWQVPGEVLLRKKLGANGAELGSMTYTWSKYTATVERNLASVGQIQTFSVEPNGNFTGTLLLNGAMGREKWETLGATGYRVTTETNEGHGWVLGNDAMWQLATSDALAGARQTAELMRQMYKNKKEVAEIKAKMQGSMTDAEFDQHIAELTARNAAYAEARRLKREARANVIGGLFVAAAGATAVAVNGGDALQVLDGASRAAQIAGYDNPIARGFSEGLSEARQQQAHSDARQAEFLAGLPNSAPAIAARPGNGSAANTDQQRAPSRPEAASSSTSTTAAPASAGNPLRFVMRISMKNLPGDTVNPSCYSNVITRPGPAGWGADTLPSGSFDQARQVVEGFKSAFIAKCRASGRDITSEGNFSYEWNRYASEEGKVDSSAPRNREDILVSF